MKDRIDIQFERLHYNVRTKFYDVFGRNKKEILKEINGEFRSSELTAIMGPSGSGKSSLLNILSGFVTTNISGSVKVNGKPRDYKAFRKQSTYIMQEQNFHSLLTLSETMHFSMKLKTGVAFNREKRESQILIILENLGLDSHVNTFVKNLSGGQQKRLSIAVELVDDPMVIFLDEPTTGLDSSSSTQCIQLLKNLALEGKTVIFTIHTPSARLFEKFDHLYAIADGQCMYQGASSKLVPFLKELDLVCPETFNPADFLLEIACNEYGPQNDRLIEKIQNGKSSIYRENFQPLILPKDDEITTSLTAEFSTSFINQVVQLTARNALFNLRDKSYMFTRLIAYVFVGLLIGVMYFRIGDDAKQIINIFKSIYTMVAFLMYTSLYSLSVRFTLDLPIIQREHFNRWYSTAAHYIALILADFPILLVCSVIFTFVSYIMTNHPLEDFRLFTILGIGLIMSFTSQAYGIFAGCLFTDIKLSLLFAALLMVYQIIFAGGLVFMKDVSPIWFWLFEISFMKHALDGYGSLVLGFNRTHMNCDEIYCHFIEPKKFMSLIGMQENIPKVFYSLAIIWAVFHLVTYSIMRMRLSH